ncbi:flavin reductase-like, FMN-binding protein [Arthrobacter crystallopoietes BAB-32]|uniref:Flavin reductase-like, FMN-binding protein n=1 Tax=Arthrobacter crystallopoietes BAB-32 TaxID=1246476 RepID=N1UVD1_9MICC|nr:flavin reductase family protein [Arthrobacter crystallopoietes]EMY33020.1 flavin reductase-like, FMN-binding protein [Arthrobacter crystallopoietes BAB-32]
MSTETFPDTVASTISPDHFRAVMRHLPTGVAAICAEDPETGGPAGLIVGTFQSLSLDPALVTFSVARTSSSWPKVARARWFSVSLLADGQQPICKALSSKTGDKFQSISWTKSQFGTPHIDGALGWIDCAIREELDGGDHILIVAEVLQMQAAEGEPLVFHGGRLGSFRESAAS